MGQPYKVRHTMQYTEVVYYDGSGNELERDRIYDDHTYDTGEREPLDDHDRDILGIEDEGA